MPRKSKSSYARGGLLNSSAPVLISNPNEFSLGGIFGEIGMGAGSGALGGAAFGGIGAIPGALIGGGVGLIKGLFGHSREKKAEAAQEEFLAQQEAIQPIVPALESARTFSHTQNIPTFQLGGGMDTFGLPQPSEEKAIDKMLVDFVGPTHEDGGIAIAGNEVEGEETMFRFKDPEGKVQKFIFSDTLMVPDTKKSFARTSKDINNRTERRPDSDRITNRSKESELKTLMAQQMPLTAEAEGDFRLGGVMRSKSFAPTIDNGSNIFMTQRGRTLMRRGGRMYENGTPGPLQNFAASLWGKNSFSFPQVGTSGAGANINAPGNFLAPTTGRFAGVTPFGIMPTRGGVGTAGAAGRTNRFPGLGTDLLGSSVGLLGALGPLAQLKLSGEDAEQIEFERAPLPGAPQFVDPTQTVRGIQETFGGVRQGIRETASRPGQSITGQIEAGTREAGAIGDVRGRFANVNAGIANRRAELATRVGGQNALIARSEEMTNLASRGARESARIDALTSLGNIGGQFGRDVSQKQAQRRQNAMMELLLKNAFANIGYADGAFTT